MWHISYTLNNNLIHSQKRDKVIMPAVNFTGLLQFVNKLQQITSFDNQLATRRLTTCKVKWPINSKYPKLFAPK